MKGLCLAGGGIKAAAHIGALKAFEEENIKFDSVSGASSGSIIAAMYALGYNSDEMWKMFQKYVKKIKYVEWKNIIEMVIGLLFTGKIIINGLNSGKVIEKIIKEICNEKDIQNINEIEMPLLITMVGLQVGTLYVASSKNMRYSYSDKIKYITDMPIGKAVRASCSFPFVIEPCTYNDIEMIDGGIRENLPWKELKDIGTDEVYGIEFQTILDEKDCCSNMIDVATRSVNLLCHELSIYEKNGIDKLITIPLKKVALLDNSKIFELYDIGYKETKRQLTLQKSL